MTDPAVQPTPAPAPAHASGLRLVLTLMIAGLVSGVLIVGVYVFTKPIIEANDAAALNRAVLIVTPGSAKMQGLVIENGSARAAGDGDTPGVFAAYDESGRFVAYAIPGAGPGFQDTIKLIYGYDPAARLIVGMEILDSRETPGLGDKIYKDQAFVGTFSALAVDPGIVCVKAGEKVNPYEVDAITGATISSKAVVSIIAGANERWLDQLPAADAVPAFIEPVEEATQTAAAEGGNP